jgi:hypothetical protein
MVSRKDIYLSANVLIQRYGNEAETIAWKRMHELMDKDDVRGASVWLSIAGAIDDLQNVKRQGTLH